MNTPTQEVMQRMEHFKDILKQAGIKLTHQRIEIFREVAETCDHPDAETIFNGVQKRVPTISLDTVYRTLWLFLDLGLINTPGTPRGSTRFDANTKHHHHFVCSQCGMMHDFYSNEFDQLAIPDEVKALGNIEKTQVEVRGICRNCSQKP